MQEENNLQLLGNGYEEPPKEESTISEPSKPEPKPSVDRFGDRTKSSEQTENHVLTPRQAAKLFEQGGLPISERTVLNWCLPNKRGEYKLDCYFDEVDSRYYITPQSVQEAIAKDRSRLSNPSLSEDLHIYSSPPKPSAINPNGSEGFQKSTEPLQKHSEQLEPVSESNEVVSLKNENRDLKITNAAKDMHIAQLEKDRQDFNDYLTNLARENGELLLENRQLKQLEAPGGHQATQTPVQEVQTVEPPEGSEDEDSTETR